MMTSVPSGRWGPCASTAPTGRTATVRVRSRSRASSHVISASSRIAIVQISRQSGVATRPAGVHHGAASPQLIMTYEPPERLNIADYFLDARVREGRGARAALHTRERTWTYDEVRALAHRFANRLAA